LGGKTGPVVFAGPVYVSNIKEEHMAHIPEHFIAATPDLRLLRTNAILPEIMAIVKSLGKDVSEGLTAKEVEAQVLGNRSSKVRRLFHTAHVCDLLGISPGSWWRFASANNLKPAKYVDGLGSGNGMALWPPAIFVGLVMRTRCPKCGKKVTTSKFEWDAQGRRCLGCKFIDEKIV
jgi:hypothetical protein